MEETALVTRVSLAIWTERRAPSSRISLSTARRLRLVLFFGVVPACIADILHRLRRSANGSPSPRCVVVLWDLKASHAPVPALFQN